MSIIVRTLENRGILDGTALFLITGVVVLLFAAFMNRCSSTPEEMSGTNGNSERRPMSEIADP